MEPESLSHLVENCQRELKMLVRLYRSGKHASFVLNCYDVGLLVMAASINYMTNTTIMMTRPKVGIQVREKKS